MNTKRNDIIPVGFPIGVGILAATVIGPILKVWTTGSFNLIWSLLWTIGSLGVAFIILALSYEYEIK